MFPARHCRLMAIALLLAAAYPVAAEQLDGAGVWPQELLATTIDLSRVTAEPPAKSNIWLLGGESPADGGDQASILPIGDHPGYPNFPPCYCDQWAPWYIGVEGGWAFGLNDTPDSQGVGANFNGTAFGTHLRDGSVINVRVGRRFSPRWRADFSYNQIHGDYDWQTAFPGQLAGFDSSATSHLLLFSGYWHFLPPAERCDRLRFDPYLGAGIGVAFNKLYATDEFTAATGDVYAQVFSDTTACFAARFTLGTHLWLTPNLAIDMSFATSFVGDFQTDDFRTIDGSVQQIGRYDFHNNWIGTAQMGLVWFPQPGFYRK